MMVTVIKYCDGDNEDDNIDNDDNNDNDDDNDNNDDCCSVEVQRSQPQSS